MTGREMADSCIRTALHVFREAELAHGDGDVASRRAKVPGMRGNGA